MNKDQKDLVRAAERAGWRVDPRGKHVKIYPPIGPMIPVANSGKGRGNANTRAMLRRAGLDC